MRHIHNHQINALQVALHRRRIEMLRPQVRSIEFAQQLLQCEVSKVQGALDPQGRGLQVPHLAAPSACAMPSAAEESVETRTSAVTPKSAYKATKPMARLAARATP